MIKNCKVLINNDAVTVVQYGKVEVQLPSIKRKVDYLKIDCHNGKYIIVDDNNVKPIKKLKKRLNKKTTVKESVEKTISDEVE